MDNIELFMDTQNRIKKDPVLLQMTRQAENDTYIIGESFFSNKLRRFAPSRIRFEDKLTLIPAIRLCDSGRKTAVLNFANPLEPGGGVLRGANAQEEYLCRASNLYNCLISPGAAAFYQKHNELFGMDLSHKMFLGTDTVIYSPGVTFFREDQGYEPDNINCRPEQVYTENWRKIDVITCAAPYFNTVYDALPNGDLYHLFIRRIQNILESAIENEVDSLVLGAFGCGAFNNPPSVVSKAFHNVFLMDRYRYAFADVIFAVKRSGNFSKNIEAFEIAFQSFP